MTFIDRNSSSQYRHRPMPFFVREKEFLKLYGRALGESSPEN